jgi:isopentenyl-diphosphate delta-isomerase
MTDDLILVNPQNRALGRSDKHTVHQAGLLHRAFSIFLVDAGGRILLQQRHPAKYHSGGLWTNSCCGHPRPFERTLHAARRRLGEELGTETPLTFGFRTRYYATFPNGLVENEIVYVYFGPAPETVRPDSGEISAVTLTSLADLKTRIQKKPGAYSFWLKFYIACHLPAISDGVSAVLKSPRQPR